MSVPYRFLNIEQKLIDMVENTRSSVLYGNNGSGKTTFLEFLQEYYTSRDTKVIYFPATRWFELSESQIKNSLVLGSLLDTNFFSKYSIDHEQIDSIKLYGKPIGSGLHQIVHILSTLILEHDDVVVLIDEPERNLDMDIQREMISDILGLKNVKSLIIATHSPFIASDYISNMIDIEQYVSM